MSIYSLPAAWSAPRVRTLLRAGARRLTDWSTPPADSWTLTAEPEKERSYLDRFGSLRPGSGVSRAGPPHLWQPTLSSKVNLSQRGGTPLSLSPRFPPLAGCTPSPSPATTVRAGSPFSLALSLPVPPPACPIHALPGGRRRKHPNSCRRWEGFRESRRCSRDTCPESYITECILIYDDKS